MLLLHDDAVLIVCSGIFGILLDDLLICSGGFVVPLEIREQLCFLTQDLRILHTARLIQFSDCLILLVLIRQPAAQEQVGGGICRIMFELLPQRALGLIA